MDKNIKTTGVGSLPHLKVSEGIDYSLRHDIAFLPQFFNIEGSMIDIAKNCLYPNLDLFLEKIKDKGMSQIKLQLVGPNSSKLELDVLCKNIDYLARKSEKFETLFIIDEPILEPDSSLEELLLYAKNKFNQIGIHCCASNIDHSLINTLPIDGLSYDCFLNEDLDQKIKKDIKLMFGIIDKTGNTYPLKTKRKDIIISTTCGLGLSKLDPEDILNNLIKEKSLLLTR